MKNLALATIVTLALASCQSNADKARAMTDSLGTDTVQHTVKQYPDSLQKKVVGDIRFGMDSNEFVKLSKAFLKAHESGKRYKLGNFEFITATPAFDKGRLYQVELSNPFVKDEQVTGITKAAIDAVSAQYGQPDSTGTTGAVLTGYQRDAAVWHIGAKAIRVAISNPFGNGYAVTMQFTDTHTASHIQANNTLKKDSITKSAKNDL